MAFRTKRATRRPGGDLGKALRHLRLRMDLGQVGLARLLGWPQCTLSLYESGDSHPSADRLIVLLRLAAGTNERGVILKALDARGVRAADLAFPETDNRGNHAAPDSTPSASGQAEQIAVHDNAQSAEMGAS